MAEQQTNWPLSGESQRPKQNNKQVDSKEFASLVCAFALRGHTLIRSGDGFMATRWNLARYLSNLDEAKAFLHQIGGKPL